MATRVLMAGLCCALLVATSLADVGDEASALSGEIAVIRGGFRPPARRDDGGDGGAPGMSAAAALTAASTHFSNALVAPTTLRIATGTLALLL